VGDHPYGRFWVITEDGIMRALATLAQKAREPIDALGRGQCDALCGATCYLRPI